MQYIIRLSGLKEGVHNFDFDVEASFWEKLSKVGVTAGQAHVNVDLEKYPAHMILCFKLKGEVQLECDRCLDKYLQKLSYDTKLHIKFSDKRQEEESDDILYLKPSEHQIDIGWLIYESIMLCIPIRRVHPEGERGSGGCNRDMLKRIDELSIKKSNNEALRWHKLKELVDKSK